MTVPPERALRLLGGHSRRGRPRPPLENFLTPAGGLRSSAEDILRFLTACLTPPAGELGAALALAQQPHTRMRSGVAMGLCWIVSSPQKGPTVIWHNGGTWGFRAFAGFAPERGSASVVLSNTARGVERTGLRLIAGAPSAAY